MLNDSLPQLRTVEEIESEFSGILHQHWPPVVARQRFEVIWDEVNVAATTTLGNAEGSAYVALLSRMQYEFDKQYRGVPLYRVSPTTREMR